jgi:RNA-directed DNA polymerase
MISSLFKKNEFKKLCATIGFKPIDVSLIVANIDKFYYIKKEYKLDKITGERKTYKDGTEKMRIIHPSVKELKAIQKSIKNNILTQIPLPQVIHGGVKKKSNISNAKPHKGKKYKFTTDLQEFYPNITNSMVYETFLSLKFSNHMSNWLTKLTTWKHKLPQGAPTSTHVSNLVFLKTDYKLIQLCNDNNITYTRYVDDLTFSSQHDFRHLLNEILEIVLNDNFKISYRKTKYKGDQTITGIEVFLNKIDAPQHIKDKAQLEIDTNSVTRPYGNYVNRIELVNNKKGYS